MDEGNRANEESNAIAAIVSEMPGFGGIWVDKAGITHVAVQHGKTRDFAKALEEHPTGQHVLDEVEFSYNDLASRVNSISKHMGVLKALGLNLLEWGPDEKKNTVWISLRDYSEEKAARARKILGEDILVSAATVAADKNDLFSRAGDYPRLSDGMYRGRDRASLSLSMMVLKSDSSRGRLGTESAANQKSKTGQLPLQLGSGSPL
ncbi:hypothetical protein ACFUTU_09320 [Arthrobacter sp. NPDC057388]|uniref:hypothetical protein n=1 Tax=Arthrobacter sp. NPDC057388 TaxID=3346116 RepID=UPI00362CF165